MCKIEGGLQVQQITINIRMSEPLWEKTEIVDSFEELDLKQDVLKGVYGYGFEKPLPIQQIGISPIAKGLDLFIQARSGTSKSATYVIGALQKQDYSTEVPKLQTLILVPMSGLGQQIKVIIDRIGEFIGVKSHCCLDVQESTRALSKGVHTVVGMPGRVFDMIQSNALCTSSITTLIIDEIDELVARGFKAQIFDIFRAMPEGVQVCMFVNRFSPEIDDVAKLMMHHPKYLMEQREVAQLEGVKQYYILVEREEWKFDVLCDLLDYVNGMQVIIYCNTRGRVLDIADRLKEKNFNAVALHVELTSQEREIITSDIRIGHYRCIVTTDLSAPCRLHFIPIKVSYDFPRNLENYAPRFGLIPPYKKALAISLVSEEERDSAMREAELLHHTTIDELPVDVLNTLFEM